MLIRTEPSAPPVPRHKTAYGPAAMVRSYVRVPVTGPNCHSPACPAGGRPVTGPLLKGSQPAGSARLRVVVAVRSGWSKQQKKPGAWVG